MTDYDKTNTYSDKSDLVNNGNYSSRKPTPTEILLEDKKYPVIKYEKPGRMTMDQKHGTGLEGLVKYDKKE